MSDDYPWVGMELVAFHIGHHADGLCFLKSGAMWLAICNQPIRSSAALIETTERTQCEVIANIRKLFGKEIVDIFLADFDKTAVILFSNDERLFVGGQDHSVDNLILFEKRDRSNWFVIG